jgi:hypothetical protein
MQNPQQMFDDLSKQAREAYLKSTNTENRKKLKSEWGFSVCATRNEIIMSKDQ